MTTDDDQVPTAVCRICQIDVPAGEYCGLCGCHLTPRKGEGPDWLRIRDFEQVLRRGLLGAPAEGEYSRLSNGDQGMIREFYLASLEKVAPELRGEYAKIYAYY